MHFRSIIFITSLDAKWLNTDLLLVAGCCITEHYLQIVMTAGDTALSQAHTEMKYTEKRAKKKRRGITHPPDKRGITHPPTTTTKAKKEDEKKTCTETKHTYRTHPPKQQHTKQQQQQKTAIPPQQHQKAQPTFKTRKITLTVQSISKVCGKNNTFCPGYLSESCIHYVWRIKIKVGDGI